MTTIQDSGSDERFTDTMLVVNLVDVLDPPPAFSLREYNVEVSEGMYTDVSVCLCFLLETSPPLVYNVLTENTPTYYIDFFSIYWAQCKQ